MKQRTVAIMLLLLGLAGCDPAPPPYRPADATVPDPGSASFRVHGQIQTGVSAWSR